MAEKKDNQRHRTQRRRCRVEIGYIHGKKTYCGMPLDEDGKCPDHP